MNNLSSDCDVQVGNVGCDGCSYCLYCSCIILLYISRGALCAHSVHGLTAALCDMCACLFQTQQSSSPYTRYFTMLLRTAVSPYTAATNRSRQQATRANTKRRITKRAASTGTIQFIDIISINSINSIIAVVAS